MKHKQSVFMVIALFISFAFFAGAQTSDKYFRQIERKTNMLFEGRYPVAAEKAKTVNCFHFQYDKDGRPMKIEYLRGGKLREDRKNDITQIKIEYEDKAIKYIFLNEKGFPKENFDGYFTEKFLLDEKNNPYFMIMYERDWEEPVDEYVANCFQWVLDEKGRPAKQFHLNKYRDYTVDYKIVYEIRYTYDENGFVTSETYFNDKGKQITMQEPGSEGTVSKIVYKNDKYGNHIEESFYDVNNKIINSEYAKVKSVFDENGFMTEHGYYNDQDKPVNMGDGCALTVMKYDNAGNVTEVRNLDENRKLVMDEEKGGAILKNKYNECGDGIELAKYDSDEKLMVSSDQEVIQKNTFNDLGKITEQRLYNDKNELFANPETGIAVTKYKYDDNGNWINESYLDKNEKPAYDQATNNLEVNYKYDKYGQLTQESYKKFIGLPGMDNSRGPDTLYHDRNDKGKLTSKRASKNGRAMINGKGYAEQRWKYDETGKLLEMNFLDEAGKPVETWYGVSTIKYKYEGNYLSEIRHLDQNGKPAGYKAFSPILKFKYDTKGNLQELSFFDENEKPVFNDDFGYASKKCAATKEAPYFKFTYYDEKNQEMKFANPKRMGVMKMIDPETGTPYTIKMNKDSE